MPSNLAIEKFWKPALAIGGVATIGAFVFYGLYKNWLELEIFAQLTPKQTFTVMLVFLVLVFLVAVAMLIAWVVDRTRDRQAATEPSITFSVPSSWSFEQAIKALNLVWGQATGFKPWTRPKRKAPRYAPPLDAATAMLLR